MKKSLLLALTFSLFSVSLLLAQEIRLEEVVVTATRIEEPVEEITSSVIVITREEIERMNVQFLPDVLRKVSDLNLVQHGGAGKLATVFLRGGASKHTLVMIDGVKVNSPTTGVFDFSAIHIDDIERIEIVKGPQSTIYGSDAMAGVLNIITKKGKEKLKIDASFEAGSYGTYKPSFSISGGSKALHYRVTATHFYSDGISTAKDGIEKDGYKNTSFSGKFGSFGEKTTLEFLARYQIGRNELDDWDFWKRTTVDDQNYIQHSRNLLASGKVKILTGIWEQILTVSTTSGSLKDRNPKKAWLNSEVITSISAANWQHNLHFSDLYTLVFGADYKREFGESVGFFKEAIDLRSVYLNNKLIPLKDVVVNAGLRYDKHEKFGGKTTYRAGAMYHIRPAMLRLKGSYATGFRAPTLNELFYPEWGDPTLRPENTTSWEVGLEKDIIKGFSVSLAYFDQDYKDLIATGPAWRATNIGKAAIKGIETDLTLKPTKYIDIKAGYTNMEAKDKTTGERLPRRPNDKFVFKVGLSVPKLYIGGDVIYVGKRYDSPTKKNLPPYSLVNLSSSYKLAKNISLFGRIENLFDKSYEEAGTYGVPGLSAYLGTKITL